MKRVMTLLAFVTCLFVSCGSLSPQLYNQQMNDGDTSNSAMISYSGSSSTLKLSLYKINNVPRQKYLDKTLGWSYTQTGSLGFSLSLPVGDNNFEFVDFINKKIISVNCDLSTRHYAFDFKKDIVLYEIQGDKKVNIPINISSVKPYNQNDYQDGGKIYIDKVGTNQIVIFRINRLAPPDMTHRIGTNYAYNDIEKDYSIDLPVGEDELEIGINGTSAGLSGQKYFIVNIVHLNVESGKKYRISVEKTKIDDMYLLKPVISEI